MTQMMMQDLMVFFGLMTTLGCVTTVVLSLIRRKRELPAATTSALSSALADLAQRLERIEQGIETTAVEIERVSEGQRFTATLLAERNRPAVGAELGSRGRVVTPH